MANPILSVAGTVLKRTVRIRFTSETGDEPDYAINDVFLRHSLRVGGFPFESQVGQRTRDDCGHCWIAERLHVNPGVKTLL